jgi:HK97 family phage portal protein
LFGPKASGNARPAEWLFEALVGARNASGTRINQDTALNIAAVWACVRLISESVASLPLILYRPEGEGRERVLDHPLYDVLKDAPNQYMSSMTFRTTLTAHVLTWGNGYAEIKRSAGNQVRELLPITPDMVKLVVDGANRMSYEIINPDKSVRNISRRNMLHIAGLGYDGLQGYSPIRRARESLGLASATELFGASLFGNGVHAGGILEHPGQLSDKAKQHLEESLRKRFSGPADAHKTMVIEEGMKWSQTTIPPDDSQFLETRKFQVEEIARWYAVPPHMIQSLERATFSNIEHQAIQFVIHTLRPWLIRWEQEVNRKLIPVNDDIYSEHLVDALQRGDIKTRYEAYNIGRNAGFLSPNDIRRMENMPEIDGGDEYLAPLNMRPASEQAENRDAMESVFKKQLEALAKGERSALSRAERRHERDDALAIWMTQYLKDRPKRVQQRLGCTPQEAELWMRKATDRLIKCQHRSILKRELLEWVDARINEFEVIKDDDAKMVQHG